MVTPTYSSRPLGTIAVFQQPVSRSAIAYMQVEIPHIGGRLEGKSPPSGCRKRLALRSFRGLAYPNAEPHHLTRWVHVTRPAAATATGCERGRLGRVADTPALTLSVSSGAS